MIRGYAPPTSANSYGLCLRRRAKKSRLRLFFFARQPALPYGNTVAADFCAICIRIRSPRQSGTWQCRASMGCAESAALSKAGHGSAEQVRTVPSAQTEKEPLAALFLCTAARRIRGGTPHPPRQARHLPPLGKAKDYFCFHAGCKVSAVSVALKELYFRNQTKPSPVGEGGPLAVDEVSRTKAKRVVEGAMTPTGWHKIRTQP